MEEAVLRLMKVTAESMKAMYQYGASAESVVDNILTNAELAIHPQSREELIEYYRTLN